MEALIVTAAHELTCRQIPEPAPGPYEALVQILGCGICNSTDREIIRGRQPFHSDYPCILGHEGIGRVLEVGPKVGNFKVGDLVTRPAAIFPGTRRDGLASGWGGFAQLGLVKDRRAMIADGDDSLAADFTALRQNVVPGDRPLRELVLGIALSETADWITNAGSLRGKRVCVAGTGIAGLSIALWSKLGGAAQVIVIGRRDSRLELAKKIAADHTLNATSDDLPAGVRELTHGQGVDCFFEAVGKADQINLGLSLIAPGGLVAIYGVPPGQKYDLTFSCGPTDCHIAQYTTHEYRIYPWVMRAMQRGWIPVDLLMTHEWPMRDWQKAFAQVADGQVVKGFLRMPT